MKMIKEQDYVFSVDVEKTEEYYCKHSICDCSGCRNFYAQIKGKYPELEDFLLKLGVDIARPDEMPWWDIDDCIDYNPNYTVTGTIQEFGEYEIDFGEHSEINVVVQKGETPILDIPNEQTEPYFVLSVYNIRLPWILDEEFLAVNERENLWGKIKRRLKRK